MNICCGCCINDIDVLGCDVAGTFNAAVSAKVCSPADSETGCSVVPDPASTSTCCPPPMSRMKRIRVPSWVSLCSSGLCLLAGGGASSFSSSAKRFK